MGVSNNRAAWAHLSIFTAEVFWGLMAPITKSVIAGGIDSVGVVTFRVVGAALLFWLASLFTPGTHVPRADKIRLAGAGLVGIATNQCLYTIGLGLTSPIDASIITTSMPIFAMILSFIILHEPITWLKAGGVAIGCVGALILVWQTSVGGGHDGNLAGDLLCMVGQLSFALYLSLFNPVVRRYDAITVNKYMFGWATLIVAPFTLPHTVRLPWASISVGAWLGVSFIVCLGTFICYLLSINAQKVLRPTVVSIYNYVQPIVAVSTTVLVGMSVFTPWQGAAIVLVFVGVWFVSKSKSRRDMDANGRRSQSAG